MNNDRFIGLATFLMVVLVFFGSQRLVATTCGDVPVSTIAVSGLDRVSLETVMGVLRSRSGEKWFDSDRQALLNTRLFHRVNIRSTCSDGQHDVAIVVAEVITLLPIVRFQAGVDQWQATVGAVEHNLSGRHDRLRVAMTHYDRLSVEVGYGMRQVFETPVEIEFEFAKRARNEPADPLYFDRDVTFAYDQTMAAIDVGYRYPNHWKGWVGGALLSELYRSIGEVNAIEHGVNKVLLRSRIEQDARNYNGTSLHGFYQRLSVEVVAEDPLFWKMEFDWRHYWRPLSLLNTGIRFFGGLSRHVTSPYVPFVIDSLQNVRGSGNRVRRGSAIAGINSELRYHLHTLFNSAFQLVVFGDVASIRPVREHTWPWFATAGVGTRLTLLNYYATVLRADVTWNIRSGRFSGFVLGTGHFF